MSPAQLYRGPKWAVDEDKKLLDMVAAGKSWVAISAALKRSQKSVRERVRTLKRKDGKP
jgi:hypothetical protein